jgi:predicted nucleic acid-binding protein
MTAMGSGSPEPVTAFLDANVIWGSLESDLLLTLADRGVIQAFWSERVLAEVSRTVHRRRPGANIEGRLAAMRSSFPSAMVRGFEHLEPAMPADAGDRHVLAAAVHCGAAYLVTDNVKHFWPAQADLSIGEVSGDDFCRALLLQRPGRVLDAVRDCTSQSFTSHSCRVRGSGGDSLAAEGVRLRTERLAAARPARSRTSLGADAAGDRHPRCSGICGLAGDARGARTLDGPSASSAPVPPGAPGASTRPGVRTVKGVQQR